MSKTARDVIHEWGLDEEDFEKTDSLIATLAAENFVIVLKEPSEEMSEAGVTVLWQSGVAGDEQLGSDRLTIADIYRAMLGAAS